MNPPIKKLTVVITLMFVVLMTALTYIHFFQAPSLNADSRNARTIYREYNTDRGDIIVAGSAIASSQPSEDKYKYQRTYTNGPLYAALTGYFSVRYDALTGLERAQNSVLSGSDSSLFAQRIQDLITGKQPTGGSVSLTINPEAQTAAAQALGNRAGAVVAIEPSTGRILALYSSPSYDPNQLASHDWDTAKNAWEAISNDPAKPTLNRATGGDLYPPGSTFKIITASAMLESGLTADSLIDAPTTYNLPGSSAVVTNTSGACGDGSGKATMRTALVLSCNTAFASGAVSLGADKIIQQAEAYGFNKEVDIGLPTSASLFPTPDDDAALALDAFGQKDIQASALQMAMVSAAVANHGILMKPYIVDETLTSDLQTISRTEPKEFSRPISPQTADELTSMMKDVVTAHPSTGVAGVPTAGKTGTAENSGEPHAWYMAFDIAQTPRVAVAVFVQNGGDGASEAGPIAAQVIKAVVG